MVPTPELYRIAAAYPPEARHVPAWERKAHMTETQQLAWLIRFDPEAAADALSAVYSSEITKSGATGACNPYLTHRIPHHG